VGSLPISGATGGVLKRSLSGLKNLMDAAIVDLRRKSAGERVPPFSALDFITEAAAAAHLHAEKRGCVLTVRAVDSSLAIAGDRDRLLAALANLVQNAFKYTREASEIVLSAYEQGAFVRIDVRDHCGGLAASAVERMFAPFAKLAENKTGLGLGLSISRQSVELDGGTLNVQNLPGEGCIFTIQLPRYELA